MNIYERFAEKPAARHAQFDMINLDLEHVNRLNRCQHMLAQGQITATFGWSRTDRYWNLTDRKYMNLTSLKPVAMIEDRESMRVLSSMS